ncbi:MAG: MBL fold metallo-hydrolase [Myxococcota bacterium]
MRIGMWMTGWMTLGCARPVSTVPAGFHPPAEAAWEVPGPLVHEAVISARWSVPLSGLLDLKDPRAAEFEDRPYDIVLPVHVLVHPEVGAFVIDTGMPRAPLAARGLVARFVRDIEIVEPLADILSRQQAPLVGVLLTHTHLDHILGLPDVPLEVPVYAGPGDERPHSMSDRLSFGAFRRGLGDRPLTLWRFEAAAPLGPIEHAVDVLGDGSLWALHVPGHTPGSTAYLARTTHGPVLFTGDCSHTRWGFDHGVTPGTYTVDHEANAHSLEALRALAASIPGLRVEVGHE